MIADSRSRPWSSVPRTKVSPVNAFGSSGGVKPFIRFSEAGSKGLVGATKSASNASRISVMTIVKDTMVTGERLKSKKKSLSTKRCQVLRSTLM